MIIEPDFDPAMLIDDFKKYLAAGDVGESFMEKDFNFYTNVLLSSIPSSTRRYLLHLVKIQESQGEKGNLGEMLAREVPRRKLLEVIQDAFDELYDVQEFCDSHSIPYQTFVDEYDYNGVSRTDFF